MKFGMVVNWPPKKGGLGGKSLENNISVKFQWTIFYKKNPQRINFY